MIMDFDGKKSPLRAGEDTMLGRVSKSYLACSKKWEDLTSTEKNIMLITAAKKNVKSHESGPSPPLDYSYSYFSSIRPSFSMHEADAWQNAWTIPDDSS